jgi:uncharacterized protein YciI
MLFLRLCLDKPGAASIRDAHRAAHRAYLTSPPVTIVQAGPLLDEDGGMIGSMIIVDAESLNEVRAFHEGDPFTKIGLFQTAHLVRWDRHIGN